MLVKQGSKIEILYEEGGGWYAYRDWGYAGEYLFKKFQLHWGAPAFNSEWVRPTPFYTNKEIVYFDSKTEVELAISNIEN